jgi:hypothetical protein
VYLRKERILGPKKEEVTGGGGKLHNEELYNLFCSPNIIMVWRMKWAGYVACMGDLRN